MRHLATIQRIAEILPIESADNIEKARINDWWLVVKKDEFKVGDLCVYFEIDSFLPIEEQYAFLQKGSGTRKMLYEGQERVGIRLKTIRLRGQISQGLALPVETFRARGYFTAVTKKEGDDVSEELNVIKYEQPVPACLAGKVKGNFPPFIPKTDEERIQNCGYLLTQFPDTEFRAVEKLDGSSATFYKEAGVFGVCSRNLDLLETEGNSFWQIAKKYNLPEILSEGMAIQGELVGPGIQQNPLKLSEVDLYVFNVFDIHQGKYLDADKASVFCATMGLKEAPVLPATFLGSEMTVEELLKLADGKSFVNPTMNREGIVCRPMTVIRTRIGGNNNQRLSFKAISNYYLLREKE